MVYSCKLVDETLIQLEQQLIEVVSWMSKRRTRKIKWLLISTKMSLIQLVNRVTAIEEARARNVRPEERPKLSCRSQFVDKLEPRQLHANVILQSLALSLTRSLLPLSQSPSFSLFLFLYLLPPPLYSPSFRFQ